MQRALRPCGSGCSARRMGLTGRSKPPVGLAVESARKRRCLDCSLFQDVFSLLKPAAVELAASSLLSCGFHLQDHQMRCRQHAAGGEHNLRSDGVREDHDHSEQNMAEDEEDNPGEHHT